MADLNNFNPEFATRLDKFKSALDQAGIGYSLASGYRSPEYQNRMYQNHLAKQAKQPLPFPNDEAPDVVAKPWSSFHNYGLAADFTLKNDADYARLQAMAPQFGLSGIGMSDKGHIQLAGKLSDDIAQYKLAGWRPGSSPAPATGAIGTTVNSANAPIAGALTAQPGGGDYYHTQMMHESGGKNIPNSVGGWNAAGGYYQFTPSTYSTVRSAHPELNLPESIKDANQDQQTAAMRALTQGNVEALQKAGVPITDQNVAMAHFLGPGGASSFYNQMTANPNAAAADLFPKEAKSNPTVFYGKDGAARSLSQVFALQTANQGSGNTTGFGPDAAPPASTAVAAAPAADKPWWQKAFDAPVDAQGNPVAGGKSPLQQAASALGGGQDKGSSLQQFKKAQEEEAPEGAVKNQAGQAPGARNVSPMGGALLPSAPQTYGQTINSLATPLTWNSAPPQAPQMPASGFQGPAGPQVPGMSLTSFQAPQGIGYGVDPRIGYGYG